jgi:ATP-dependent Lon protease
MPNIKYSLIKRQSSEEELRNKHPWLGTRPLLIPSGWLGMMQSACNEIEAILSPIKAVDAVEYFFVAVRDSRLRIFIEIDEALDSEARSNAIKSLVTEVQNNCLYFCHICGKEIISDMHSYVKGALPDCGHHKADKTNDGRIGNGKQFKSVSETRLTHARFFKSMDKPITNAAEDNVNTANKRTDTTKHSIELYDVKAIRLLHRSAATRYRDKDDVKSIKEALSKLIKMGGIRVLKPLPDNGEFFLNQLEADFPNFSQVIDMLRGVNALSSKEEVSRIPAILLLGPPGVGKTMFAEALAHGMQVPFKVVRMENQQAGAGLVGSAEFWSNSKPGAVFNILTNGDCGNPIIVVDEIDKAARDSQYNPVNGLYSLLESGSASTFHDESFPEVKLDASKVTWILTANYQQQIPEPILSRVRVFDIQEPDQAQAIQIARRIYQMLLNESMSLKQRFADTLADDVARLLADLSPRKMKLAIEIALGKAALVKRSKLIIEDFDITSKQPINKIGFI